MALKNKTVLVTGASRGLGRAIAEAFVAANANVVVIGRDAKALAETEVALRARGDSFRMVQLDVCDEQATAQLIRSLDRLDIVVNNAGIARLRPFLETPTQELRDILETNVIAAFVVMREAARRMVESGGGCIIHIASDAALRGIAGMAAYAGSKHALLGIGRSLSIELRQRGVRVTTFCPGPIKTDILGTNTANPRALEPAALAKMIVHLAELPAGIETQELLIQPTTL